MLFEWDDNKQASNLEKHGIDFEDIVGVWKRAIIDPFSTRHVDNELRHLALGILVGEKPTGGIIVAVVYTMRNDNHRIISARKARSSEQAAYRAAFG